MKGYIYAHINKQNNKVYIGQTIQNLDTRFGNDGNNYNYNRNNLFYNAIQKYGWNNFEHKIIYIIESESKDDLLLALNSLEEQEILKYNSCNRECGYNVESGGKNTSKSDTTKQKISNSLKGKKQSEETKQKISNSKKGKKGKKHSEETKQKIKAALIKNKKEIEKEIENIINELNKDNAEIIPKTDFVDKKTILQYVKNKYIVCVNEIIENTINDNIEITKRERIQIVKILDSLETFERVSTARFDKYGRQRGWKLIKCQPDSLVN